MKFSNCYKIILCFCIPLLAFSQKNTSSKDPVLDFLNLKFGMFIHYNMGTYTGEQWAYPFHDPKEFKPTDLDCNQWANAAKSAGMQYAVFTTKHHDGFCLWDSKVTNYDIASAEKEYRKKDIVKEYTDAFRKAGLTIGLYFSVWDRHQGVQRGNINKNNIAFTKEQLTELLTNYGEINCIVIDGWGSRWGRGPQFDELPYNTLADHIHSIQPNCLVINHSCRADLDYTQIVHYEATHGQHIPYDNTFPSQQGPVLQPTWFWEKGYEELELKPVSEVVDELEYTNKLYSNYLLNTAPNNKGLMDDNVVERLKEIGKRIRLSKPLKNLPELTKPHKNVTLKASSEQQSFSKANVLDLNLFTIWRPKKTDENPWFELNFNKKEVFNAFSMHAGYKKTIQKYSLEAFVKNKWIHLFTSKEPATFHEKHNFKEVKAKKFRIKILEQKSVPEIFEFTLIKY